jgi:hypothetical protein
MKTGPVRDAQQTKQYVYNIACDCGRCYIGETSRPSEVRVKEHKYNLTQGLLEKSKLAQHAYEEGHKICWKEARSYRLNQTPHAGNTRNLPTCLYWTIRSDSPVWKSRLCRVSRLRRVTDFNNCTKWPEFFAEGSNFLNRGLSNLWRKPAKS